MQTAENNSPDGESIKNAYIAGIQSVRALARENGISDTAIHKKAKLEAWPKPESNRKPGRKPKRKPRELTVYTPPAPEPEASPVDPLIAGAAAADHGELVKDRLIAVVFPDSGGRFRPDINVLCAFRLALQVERVPRTMGSAPMVRIPLPPPTTSSKLSLRGLVLPKFPASARFSSDSSRLSSTGFSRGCSLFGHGSPNLRTSAI